MSDGCYLIHFHEPFSHAKHYLGWASDIDERIARHAHGNGSNLMHHVNLAGIGWAVVRVWPHASRNDERRMKAHSSTRLCPICNPTGAATRYRNIPTEMRNHETVLVDGREANQDARPTD
jgi:predicted GIY-YIG superfamily endonuclease